MPYTAAAASMRQRGSVAEPSDTSLENFGYRQELKRSLGLPALIVYGLVFINPTSPFSIFGIVFNLSHGMVPLVYVIGLGAMLLLARIAPVSFAIAVVRNVALDAAGFQLPEVGLAVVAAVGS